MVVCTDLKVGTTFEFCPLRRTEGGQVGPTFQASGRADTGTRQARPAGGWVRPITARGNPKPNPNPPARYSTPRTCSTEPAIHQASTRREHAHQHARLPGFAPHAVRNASGYPIPRRPLRTNRQACAYRKLGTFIFSRAKANLSSKLRPFRLERVVKLTACAKRARARGHLGQSADSTPPDRQETVYRTTRTHLQSRRPRQLSRSS